MIKLVFLRHGATYGNTFHRYIGITNEPLLQESIDKLKNRQYPHADVVYCSPLQRCIQTAKIAYEGKDIIIDNDLCECNFGDFENKNHSELINNKDYEKWLKSDKEDAFPNGERPEEFKKRCCDCFEKIIADIKEKDITIAFVVHGGIIMSILEKFALEKREFCEWKPENAEGFCAFLTDKKRIINIEKIK